MKDGKSFSIADGTLQVKKVSSFNGKDVLGTYDGMDIYFSPDDLNYKAALRVYEGSQVAVFKQQFYNLKVSL